MANYWYQFAPFVRRDEDGMTYWGWPDGAVGVLDFRVIPVMSQIGTTESPWGFFWSVDPIPGATLLAQGDCREIAVTSQIQDKWEAALGYRPQGAKLVDLIADQFTVGSDPTGETACKPLMPGLGTGLEIHMPGHSRVWHRQFSLADPHAGKVLDLLRLDFQRLFDECQRGLHRDTRGAVDREHHRRVLDKLCEDFRTTDWQQFVPAKLRKDVPGRLPHRTVITDDFSGTLASWTAVDGGWVISSGELQNSGTGAAFPAAIRHNTSLSSDSQYAGIDYTSTVSAFGHTGGAVRFNSAAKEFYTVRNREQGGTREAAKMVTGTYSQVAGDTSGAAPPHRDQVSAIGSTISAWLNGVVILSATDTSLTGHLQVGVTGHSAVVSNGDNFEAGDLIILGRNLLYSQKLSRVSLVG